MRGISQTPRKKLPETRLIEVVTSARISPKVTLKIASVPKT